MQCKNFRRHSLPLTVNSLFLAQIIAVVLSCNLIVSAMPSFIRTFVRTSVRSLVPSSVQPSFCPSIYSCVRLPVSLCGLCVTQSWPKLNKLHRIVRPAVGLLVSQC